jgi:hypothetical protein
MMMAVPVYIVKINQKPVSQHRKRRLSSGLGILARARQGRRLKRQHLRNNPGDSQNH